MLALKWQNADIIELSWATRSVVTFLSYKNSNWFNFKLWMFYHTMLWTLPQDLSWWILRIDSLLVCNATGADLLDRAKVSSWLYKVTARKALSRHHQSREYLGTVSTVEVGLFLDPLAEFLGVRVDRLARARAHMLSDLGPVLAMEADGVQESLVLVVSPVALPLAYFVLHDHIVLAGGHSRLHTHFTLHSGFLFSGAYYLIASFLLSNCGCLLTFKGTLQALDHLYGLLGWGVWAILVSQEASVAAIECRLFRFKGLSVKKEIGTLALV